LFDVLKNENASIAIYNTCIADHRVKRRQNEAAIMMSSAGEDEWWSRIWGGGLKTVWGCFREEGKNEYR
jgi:hypothetical protein